jgi:peptidoglycan/xylan/chitin deacetylase (PgdA/CDA1 family)
MKWPELADLLGRGHEVGCHTYSHCNVGRLADGELEYELVASKRALEDGLGQRLDSFCYPFGTADSFSAASVRLIRRHYEFAFHSFPSNILPSGSPFSIGRIPLEAEWPLRLIQFRISGMMDLRYLRSRRRYSDHLHATIDNGWATPR